MPTEETTAGRGYALPYASNQLSYDVLRLRAALNGIDADMVAALAGLAGKASAAHTHAVDDVAGLTAILAGKAAASHTHALGTLSDVSTSGAATGQFLRFSGGGWVPAALAVSDVSGLAATLTSMQAAINTIDGGSF